MRSNDQPGRELPRWLPLLFVALVLVMIAVGLWALALQRQTQADNATLGGSIVTVEDQLDATADQAVDLAVLIEGACQAGTIPREFLAACQEAGTVRAVPIPAVPGAPGLSGRPGLDGSGGAPGQPGQPGTPGAPGTFGTPGQPGSSGAPGTPGPPGFNGSDGARGQAGTPGLPGAPGAPGLPGAPGCDAGTTRNADGVCVTATVVGARFQPGIDRSS